VFGLSAFAVTRTVPTGSDECRLGNKTVDVFPIDSSDPLREIYAGRTPSRARASLIKPGIRSGVSGVSRIVIPKGSGAFSTALTTAAGLAIERPSPIPFAPSDVNGEGETMCVTSMSGRSGAIGTR